MPFADTSEDGGPPQTATDHGLYECASAGSDIATHLDSQYVRINDICGPIEEHTVCDDPLDLGSTSGLNCSVEPGASAGNTQAAKTAFYHINVIKEKARGYLPTNDWLQQKLTVRVNINSTCNAYWDGRVNMYREGGGCSNTGTNMGVLVHEWGHGMDENDGGGYDNPSEGYADVTNILESHESCIGRGFYESGTCSGYGDACLSCTGIREMDWDKRESHTPATPAGFSQNNCGGGGDPCGKEPHCGSYIVSEAIWDLATRDLPASGMDPASAWLLTEKLWYESRSGSGGDAYNCSLPNSDGCGTNSWFHKLRLADDDDGNLDNGTPHAAAIFAAFDRHGIACGSATDISNQDYSSCPTLAAPSLSAKALTNAVELSWSEVPGATRYRIYRNDLGCDRGQLVVADVAAPATSFTDDGLMNDFTVYYRVQAMTDNGACLSPVSNCVESAPQPFAGKVRLDQETYGCSNRIGIKVTDANVGAPTVDVTIHSDTEVDPETVTLTETAPGSGKFVGEIYTTSGAPVHGDGLLSTTHGDLILVEYIDADDGAGGQNLVRQDTATSDCVFPLISGVGEQNVTGSSADIVWDTDEISDSVVVWGPAIPPDRTETGPDRVTQHTVSLSGLSECTVYYYEVHSTDPAGNTAIDDNHGAYYHFETLGDFGDGLQPCHEGRVTVEAPVYSCSDTVTFRVVDMDLNTDPNVAETAVLEVTSTTETDPELVTVTETGPDTSKFTGSIATAEGPPAPDGVLQTQDGDLLTVTYLDADDGTGSPAISYDTADLDCGGPEISSIHVDTLTDARGTVRWTTDEPADSVVEWGLTPDLGNTASDGALVTGHAITLNQFDICGLVYVRVRSTDEYGNTTVADDHGQPFTFLTYDIPGLYYRERFESGAPGWTLGGEWEVGPPQGLGSGFGHPDPTAAYNNTGVLGHDLTGLGAHPGDYEPNTAEVARMPAQDATSWRNTKLILYKHLNVERNDDASIWLWTTNGVPIYRSSGSTITDSSYSKMEFDISGRADGQPSLFLEFRQQADGSDQRSGWNIDDVILKDGSLPDYAPCGGCRQPPSFAGATSIQDNDACGATGITVSWDEAVSWGSGGGGTYAVYRSTQPLFTPGPSNLIASGVTGLSYNDTTAPSDGTIVFYVVRAENDETCGSGPNNGGLMDDNLVYASSADMTQQPTPAGIDTLRVDIVSHAHVRLTWEAASGATEYAVYRSASPLPGDFQSLGRTGELFYDDVGAGATQHTWFYLVRGVNACGNEGP
ncbi:MAG: hypothetical protein D6718_06775 [Acidobacteria bacterium]|nr:MAG: hypothetical protein D6718_06775 [Acidobacteriota bacterium]